MLSDEAIVTSYAAQEYLRYVEAPTVAFSETRAAPPGDFVCGEARFEDQKMTSAGRWSPAISLGLLTLWKAAVGCFVRRFYQTNKREISSTWWV
jgi:hypothetical protein